MTRSEVPESVPDGGDLRFHLDAVRHLDLRAAERAFEDVKVKLALRKMENRLLSLIETWLAVPGRVLKAAGSAVFYINVRPIPYFLKVIAIRITDALFRAASTIFCLCAALLQRKEAVLGVYESLLKRRHALYCRIQVARAVTTCAAERLKQGEGVTRHADAGADDRKYFCDVNHCNLRALCRELHGSSDAGRRP